MEGVCNAKGEDHRGPANLKSDLTTGKTIRCWFVVAYVGQRDGEHYWRCMSRASCWADFPAEKIIAEGEILDRKLNAVANGHHLREESWRNPIGWIFGEWTVLGLASTFLGRFGKQERFWKCRCICETKRDVAEEDLMSGRRPCCGCRPEEEVREQLRWKQRLAKEGWDKESGAAHRRVQDKKWTPKMERALRRFQPACVVCGDTKHLQTHHVKPWCLHPLEPGNAVRLCREHNSCIGSRAPCQLYPALAGTLETAALQFKEHWESGCVTPTPPTAALAEESPQAPDPALVTHLCALECGDDTAISALANWLEERGDPRAKELRAIASWKIYVRKRRTNAGKLRYRVEYRLGGKNWRSMVPLTPTDDYTSFFLEKRKCYQIAETWRRLVPKQTERDILKQYLGINPMGYAVCIEEIAQRARKSVKIIRFRINMALHSLTSSKPPGRL